VGSGDHQLHDPRLGTLDPAPGSPAYIGRSTGSPAASPFQRLSQRPALSHTAVDC
jgi:hypothetical protein